MVPKATRKILEVKASNFKLKNMKEKNFITVFHEGEVLEGTALSVLKGGANETACPHLQQCSCYNGNACGGREACNSNKPNPNLPTDTIPGK